jgi:hypothetical protein
LPFSNSPSRPSTLFSWNFVAPGAIWILMESHSFYRIREFRTIGAGDHALGLLPHTVNGRTDISSQTRRSRHPNSPYRTGRSGDGC